MDKESMQQLLLVKGFKLNSYDNPKATVYEYVNQTNSARTHEIAALAGVNLEPNEVIDCLILQCFRNFTNCLGYINGNAYSMLQQEFIGLIEKM